MAYKISNTDGTTLLILADNTVDESATSLSLVGKNVNGYGQYMNNNFIKLLANSANTTGNQPRSPLIGQLWYDTAARRLKIYDGTFKPVTGAVVSVLAPTTPATGDLWWDANNFQLNAWNGSIWTIVGPAFPKGYGENGWILPPYQTPVRNVDSVAQPVTLLKNYGETVGLMTTATFTTKADFTTTFLSINLGTSTFDISRGLTIFGDIYATGKIVANELDIQYTTVTMVSILTDDVYTSSNGTPSSSTSTGAIVVAGGIGVNKGIFVGGTVTATSIVSTNMIIEALTATNIKATTGAITNLTSTSISATTGAIKNLTSTNITATSVTVVSLTATTGAITNLTSTNITATSITISNTATIGKDVIASGRVYANNNLVVGSTSGEGGQLVLGWSNINGILGQTNSTWNIDVDSNNNLRIFSQNASGGNTTVLIASTSTANVTFGGNVYMGNVLTLTVSTAEPLSPAVGMFAVADRATWDPASKGSGNPYPVFYNGTTWNPLY